ncbi:MAG TPA: ribokinase [Streptosporangiaceae bacterium]|nr:ribokinase [Streptosporangiaceae bacterium]
MGQPDASAPGRVIVVGSINVDLVMRLPRLPAAGETVLGGVLARHHGGKGANQAVAAARAGARVHMVGAVGGQDGDDPVRDLAAEGVDVTQVTRREGPTGLAAVLVDAATGENQIAVAPGANDQVTVDFVDEAMESLGPRPGDVVVLCFELPGTPLLLAADLARYYGARLVVNPAPAQPDYAAVMAGAIVTPNQHELAAYAPGAGLDTAARAVRLSRQTGAPVVVTLGADGALLADGEVTERFPGHRVDAVDTTGAGDTLTGVLAASLAGGRPLRESLQRAVAGAALAVTAPGARTAMPTAAAIDELAGEGWASEG